MSKISHEEESRRRLIECLERKSYKKLPFTPTLSEYHKLCELPEGLWLVETIENTPEGKVRLFIQKPNGKTPRDFNVWVVFEDLVENKPVMPKHADFFDFFEKTIENGLGDELFEILRRLVFEKEKVDNLLSKASDKLKNFSHSFYNLELLLKTMRLVYSQEECNYPQSDGKLGMKFPFIGFILIKSKLYSAKDINRIFVMAFRKR